MSPKPITGILPVVLAASTAVAQPAVPLYDNLGDHAYAITTDVPEAQAYFDQGMRLYWAFNHEEAIRAFEEAARLDPLCAMCPWGVALSYGPNINLPMDDAAAANAYEALERTLARREHGSQKEKALIDALATRYEADPPEDRSHLDLAYAEATRSVVGRWPDDLEARTLLAEALMDLSPWQYWNADGTPGPNTEELLGHLEAVMAKNPDHPGANHLYIHAVEAVDPERAVEEAERLAGLMPGAGHIVHMPGHIYVRVGRYRDAIVANEHAVVAIRQRIHADDRLVRQILGEVRHQAVLSDGDDQVVGLEQEAIQIGSFHAGAAPGRGNRAAHALDGGLNAMVGFLDGLDALTVAVEKELGLAASGMSSEKLFVVGAPAHDDHAGRNDR